MFITVVPPKIQYLRQNDFFKNPALTTIANAGFAAAPTITANATANADDGNSPLVRYTTTAVSGNVAGLQSSTFAVIRRAWQPTFQCYWKTDLTDATEQRVWVGMSSASIDALDSPSALHVAAFRYSTSAGDATLKTVTANGSAVTVQDTGVVMDFSIFSKCKIIFDNVASTAQFYVNDVLYTTHNINLPALATNLGVQCKVTNLTSAAATHNIHFGWLSLVF